MHDCSNARERHFKTALENLDKFLYDAYDAKWNAVPWHLKAQWYCYVTARAMVKDF